MSGIPFGWTAGAIWLQPDGTVIAVPGFHDEWIRQHQELVPGCANVCDVVLQCGWLSIVTYDHKYVELMIPSRHDCRFTETALRYLGLNLEHWDTALVMTMDEEGYFKLENSDFNNLNGLRLRLCQAEPG